MKLSRSLLPPLPPSISVYLALKVVSVLGSALAVPFALIYLHNVRGIPLDIAGVIWGSRIILTLVGSLVGGMWIDARGPAAGLLAGGALNASGWIMLAFATDATTAFTAAALTGFGSGLMADGVLLSRVVPREVRHAVFSLNFAAINFAFGIGAAIASFTATASNPNSYTILLIIAGASSLPATVYIQVVKRRVLPLDSHSVATPVRTRKGGYLEALRQPVVSRVALANLAYFLAGVAVWEVGISVYLKNTAGFDESNIGILFSVNCVTIVFVQLVLTRLIEGRQRLHVLIGGLGLWIACFIGVAVATATLDGTALFISLVVIAAVIGIAECTAPPTVKPLVVDVAPEHVQGRSMALLSNGRAVGMASGAMVVGVVLAHYPSALWPSAAAILGASALSLAFLHVPEDAREIPRTRGGSDEKQTTSATTQGRRIRLARVRRLRSGLRHQLHNWSEASLTIPSAVRDRLLSRGAAGREYAETVAPTVAVLAHEWRLDEPFRFFDGGIFSLVLAASRDGEPCVLKLVPPWMSYEQERAALTAWAGNGSPDLLESDPDRRALLLSFIAPGERFSEIDHERVTRLAQQIHLDPNRIDSGIVAALPSQEQAVAQRCATARQALLDMPDRGTEAEITVAERRMYDLVSSRPSDRVVHGDFQVRNILTCERQQLVAIDPAWACIGDPAMDLAMWAVSHGHVVDPFEIAAECARLYDLDPDRVRRWTRELAVVECFMGKSSRVKILRNWLEA